MTMCLAISSLKLNIPDYSLVNQIIAISSAYALLINPIIKNIHALNVHTLPIIST